MQSLSSANILALHSALEANIFHADESIHFFLKNSFNCTAPVLNKFYLKKKVNTEIKRELWKEKTNLAVTEKSYSESPSLWPETVGGRGKVGVTGL